MKNASILTFAFILAAGLSFSHPAFANWDAKEKAQFIQDLRQASAELKPTNSGLANKLNDYADKKEKMSDKDWGQKAEDVAKLRQAAQELAPANKDLSDDLNDIADRCQKKLDKK